ncbi:hypothetical protein [Streptomyces sp. NPDC048603]|uniref:hypothetical protein n=1 Tax=Streptomyces sp. NPDC048603 TaxID=3365577 RepID=UPI0037153567
MAKVVSTGNVGIELSLAELELVRRALQLVKNFGEPDDWEPALDLWADLGERP